MSQPASYDTATRRAWHLAQVRRLAPGLNRHPSALGWVLRRAFDMLKDTDWPEVGFYEDPALGELRKDVVQQLIRAVSSHEKLFSSSPGNPVQTQVLTDMLEALRITMTRRGLAAVEEDLDSLSSVKKTITPRGQAWLLLR